MFVLDAAMGWMLGGAVGGVALIALLARQGARRRRMRDEIRMPGELTVAVRPASAAAPGAPSIQPAAPVDHAPPAQALAAAGPATLPPPSAPEAPARTPDAIRAEIAAHAERLAAARAARAAAHAAVRTRPAPLDELPSLSASDEPAPQVFDPTRSTPWQQVVESVARARHGEPSAPARAAPQPRPAPSGAVVAKLPVLTVVAGGPSGDSADRPLRILVADDARVVRVKLHRLLSAQGWQVIEASNGDEALHQLDSQRPDLLITDVDMPGLDGFSLTRAVRADAGTARLPVIMITAADDQHREEAARAGVTTLLGKPYGEAALLAHIRRLTGLKPATPMVTVAETAAA